MKIPDLLISKEKMILFEKELKLLVNQRLYDKGIITDEMYIKAKSIILKGQSASANCNIYDLAEGNCNGSV